jgi:hypothetical protein
VNLSTVHRALSWTFAALALALAVRRVSGKDSDAVARFGPLVLLVLGAGVAASGFALLPHWEHDVKQRLFAGAPALGWWFERKLHASIGALGAGATAAFASLVAASGAWSRRAATTSIAAAALLASLATSAATHVLRSR